MKSGNVSELNQGSLVGAGEAAPRAQAEEGCQSWFTEKVACEQTCWVRNWPGRYLGKNIPGQLKDISEASGPGAGDTLGTGDRSHRALHALRGFR